MPLFPDLLVVVDLLSAALVLAIAWFFLRLGLVTRDALPMATAVGFALLAVGMATVSTSAFDLARSDHVIDDVRMVAHTSASLTLAFAYVSVAWHGRARPMFIAASVLVALALLAFALYLLVPPVAAEPDLQTTMVVAHSVQLAGYITCAVLSSRNLWKKPTLRHSMVPAAFLAYALSKYTWILIDISQALALIPFIYFWRFLTISLLLTVLVLPHLLEPRRSDAAA